MIREILKYFQLPEIFDVFEDAEVYPLQKQADSDNPVEQIAEDDERMVRMREDMQRAETEAMRLFTLQRALRQAEERALQMQRLQEELREETSGSIEQIRRKFERIRQNFDQVPDPRTTNLALDRAMELSGKLERNLKELIEDILPQLRQYGFEESAGELISNAEDLVNRMQDRLFNLLKNIIEIIPRRDLRNVSALLSENREKIHLTEEQILLLIGHINVRLAQPLVEDANDAIEALKVSSANAWDKIRAVCDTNLIPTRFDSARRRAQRAVEEVEQDLRTARARIQTARAAIERIQPPELRNNLPAIASLEEIAVPAETDIPQNRGDACSTQVQIVEYSVEANQDGSLFYVGASAEIEDEAIATILRAWDDIEHYRGLIRSAEENIRSDCSAEEGAAESEESFYGNITWADIAMHGAINAVESVQGAALRVPASRLLGLRLYIPEQDDIRDIIDTAHRIRENHICEQIEGDDDVVTHTFSYSEGFMDTFKPANRRQLTEAVRNSVAGSCVDILQDLIRSDSSLPENFFFNVELELIADQGHITQIIARTSREAGDEGRVNNYVLGEIAKSISSQIAPPLGVSQFSIKLQVNLIEMGGGEGAENMAVQVLVVE